MKFAYCYAGGNIPAIKEFNIEKNANVEAGEVVCANGGVIDGTVKGGVALGVCEETHTGSYDMLNARNDGTKVRVNITDGVYETDATKLTATTEGTETIFVCASEGLSESVEGACLVLIEKAPNSTNTDKIGTVRKVSACAISSEAATLTIENGGAAFKGDVYALIPALGASLVLDSTKKTYSYVNSDTDVTLKCVGFDIDRAKVYVKLTNTIFA